jgi:hypothetical protein
VTSLSPTSVLALGALPRPSCSLLRSVCETASLHFLVVLRVCFLLFALPFICWLSVVPVLWGASPTVCCLVLLYYQCLLAPLPRRGGKMSGGGKFVLVVVFVSLDRLMHDPSQLARRPTSPPARRVRRILRDVQGSADAALGAGLREGSACAGLRRGRPSPPPGKPGMVGRACVSIMGKKRSAEVRHERRIFYVR